LFISFTHSSVLSFHSFFFAIPNSSFTSSFASIFAFRPSYSSLHIFINFILSILLFSPFILLPSYFHPYLYHSLQHPSNHPLSHTIFCTSGGDSDAASKALLGIATDDNKKYFLILVSSTFFITNFLRSSN
jgi:hypothetical protein